MNPYQLRDDGPLLTSEGFDGDFHDGGEEQRVIKGPAIGGCQKRCESAVPGIEVGPILIEKPLISFVFVFLSTPLGKQSKSIKNP